MIEIHRAAQLNGGGGLGGGIRAMSDRGNESESDDGGGRREMARRTRASPILKLSVSANGRCAFALVIASESGSGRAGGGRGAESVRSTSIGVASDDRPEAVGLRLNFKQLNSSETPGLRRRLARCSELAVASSL